MKRAVAVVLMCAVMLLAGCSDGSSIEIPEDAFEARSDTILYVRNVGRLTGREGLTNTMERFNVYGTDLGIPYYDEETGRLTLLFGDTYSADSFAGNWRSNVALYTTQTDYSQGIRFTGALTITGSAESGVAVQLTPGAAYITPLLKGKTVKTPLTHTCIPNGAVMVGSTTYLFYMEIDQNAFPATGGWGVYCNRVIKSEDHGESWEQVPTMVWQAKDENEVPGIAPNFAQIYPLKADGYVYIYGICGGRTGGAKLGRVPETRIEDFEAYEYFNGFDSDGAPIWVQGSEGLLRIRESDEAYVLPAPCGEMCVSYNSYLQKYIATYKSGGDLIYRAADTPYGVFSDAEVILAREDFGCYGAFTCQQLSDMGGQRIWLICSQWTPIYNVSQIEVVFK